MPSRLAFSVIGPAANEVARMEALTKKLRRRLIVSSELARLPGGEWESLGHDDLRGVGTPVEVLASAR